MKTTILRVTPTLAAALLVVAATPAATANTSYLSYLQEPSQAATPEPPKSASERLQNLKSRHEQAFSELSANLNRLADEPHVLGTKELFTQIDKSVSEMKNIRAACSTFKSGISSEAKSIASSKSFTEEQKKELLEAADQLAKECDELATGLDHAVARLGKAYTVLPEWNRVYKAYLNLQGLAKAKDQLKAQVDDYLKSFTPKPPKPADVAASEAAAAGE